MMMGADYNGKMLRRSKVLLLLLVAVAAAAASSLLHNGVWFIVYPFTPPACLLGRVYLFIFHFLSSLFQKVAVKHTFRFIHIKY